jgi:hypothetical protein
MLLMEQLAGVEYARHFVRCLRKISGQWVAVDSLVFDCQLLAVNFELLSPVPVV